MHQKPEFKEKVPANRIVKNNLTNSSLDILFDWVSGSICRVTANVVRTAEFEKFMHAFDFMHISLKRQLIKRTVINNKIRTAISRIVIEIRC